MIRKISVDFLGMKLINVIPGDIPHYLGIGISLND